MSALEKVLLAAAAGKSAGSSAGKSAGAPKAAVRRPDAHVLHVEHEEHLHHEHVEHEEHLHHEHVEHEEHLKNEGGGGVQHSTTTNKAGGTSTRSPASETAHKTAEATVAATRAKRLKAKQAAGSKTSAAKAPAAAKPVTPKTPGPVQASGGLDAILRLAAQDEDDACEHLHKECAWFRSVHDGQQAADFKQYCKPARGTVKLTPETAEASTVPEPTVPPGGPGLFHIKGRELPPYVQHLWHHLAPKYGKKRAYGMAVGIVKKWAAGVNPGGWKTKSGKGKRTHADVRAAAQKNVAMWEKDKADAHKQSAEHRGGHRG